jgi:hypothetical protein
MSPNHNELRIASYSEFIAAGLLFLIVAAIFIVILLMCWFIGPVALMFIWIPLGLALMIWGQLARRAISVLFSDSITVRTLRQVVNYEKVAAWSWFDNQELHLYFDVPMLHLWRIRTAWRQVEEARQWLRPELLDVEPDDDDLSEQELRAFRLTAYQDMVDRYKSCGVVCVNPTQTAKSEE